MSEVSVTLPLWLNLHYTAESTAKERYRSILYMVYGKGRFAKLPDIRFNDSTVLLSDFSNLAWHLNWGKLMAGSGLLERENRRQARLNPVDTVDTVEVPSQVEQDQTVTDRLNNLKICWEQWFGIELPLAKFLKAHGQTEIPSTDVFGDVRPTTVYGYLYSIFNYATFLGHTLPRMERLLKITSIRARHFEDQQLISALMEPLPSILIREKVLGALMSKKPDSYTAKINKVGLVTTAKNSIALLWQLFGVPTSDRALSNIRFLEVLVTHDIHRHSSVQTDTRFWMVTPDNYKNHKVIISNGFVSDRPSSVEVRVFITDMLAAKILDKKRFDNKHGNILLVHHTRQEGDTTVVTSTVGFFVNAALSDNIGPRVNVFELEDFLSLVLTQFTNMRTILTNKTLEEKNRRGKIIIPMVYPRYSTFQDRGCLFPKRSGSVVTTFLDLHGCGEWRGTCLSSSKQKDVFFRLIWLAARNLDRTVAYTESKLVYKPLHDLTTSQFSMLLQDMYVVGIPFATNQAHEKYIGLQKLEDDMRLNRSGLAHPRPPVEEPAIVVHNRTLFTDSVKSMFLAY